MRHYLLSACMAAFITSPAYGQTSTETEIISVGQRIGSRNIDQYTSPVSLIDEAEIEARGQAYIADLLRSIAGISINRSGPAGSFTQVRMRGTEANHVLVLVDGIEVSNPNTGEFDFGSLRGEDVIKIEVLRGEQSALWGSDAIGGVINIITRAGNTDEGWRASVVAGSFGTVEGQVSAVIPIGGAALSVNGNVSSKDGYDVSGLNGEKDGAKSRALNIGLNNVELGPLSLSGKLSANTAVSQFDADTNFNGRLNNTDAELKTNSDTARISARFDMGGFDNLINLTLTDTKQVTTGTSFQNDTTGKRTQANWAAEKSWGAHNFTVLAETEKERFSNFGGVGAGQNQDESISTQAVAGDYRYHKNVLTLTASARQDFNDRFKNSATWRIGVGYAFEDFGGRVRASIGTGVKNPSMTELFGFFPGSFVGNANLIPEKSLGFDIGYDQEFGDFSFSIDYFHSDLEDEILTVFNTNFTSTVRNAVTDSTREGVEIEMRGKIGSAVLVRGVATFLSTEENSIQEIRRPEFIASANVTWTPIEAMNFTLSADHTGSQLDLDFATFPAARVTLDAFTLIGLNASYHLNDIVTLSLRGDNLLNETYQEVIGYASQGRGIYAGIAADF
ncbi:MAG: TonB-dependent receptor [Robiginitomaculum sp.]|nr:TonB-dependent receptor [Robiginitomaculum sp.]